MNPFLVIAFIMSAFLFLFGVIVGYLNNDKNKSADLAIFVIVGFVLTFLFGVACAEQWESVNHPKQKVEQNH